MMNCATLACESKAFQRPRTARIFKYSTRSHTSGTSRSSCIIISREPKIYHSMLESHDWATCKHHTAVIQAKEFPRSHSGFFLQLWNTFEFESVDHGMHLMLFLWHSQLSCSIPSTCPSWNTPRGSPHLTWPVADALQSQLDGWWRSLWLDVSFSTQPNRCQCQHLVIIKMVMSPGSTKWGALYDMTAGRVYYIITNSQRRAPVVASSVDHNTGLFCRI